MAELTKEQLAAVESRGKVIVSASAGSGKTFVMIEKLSRAIEDGADLDEVLAVTFTKKAAAQMKSKLRDSLIKRIGKADGDKKQRLKTQISKISSADISTIHSFCARLLRTHFYALGIDGGFDIMADEDPAASDLKERAIENVFDDGYARADGDFLRLVRRFYEKRSDRELKRQLLAAYSEIRNTAHYREALQNTQKLYTDEGFSEVCAELKELFAAEYSLIAEETREFKNSLPADAAPVWFKIADEMISAAEESAEREAFEPAAPFTVTKKPAEKSEFAELFDAFKKKESERYREVKKGLADYETERAAFFESGSTAVAFANLLLAFDAEYTRIKIEENKLDYNDLEHFTLRLLQDGEIKKSVNSKYKYIFVDEYQDVNPVQEEIISAMDGEVFLVGDIKQAIYGFRGSKSLFFAEKFNRMKDGGSALRLSGNFRSSAEVIEFVNRLFSQVMTERTYGFDYAGGSEMTALGGYPKDCGGADILLFGKDEKEEKERDVYSVIEDSRPAPCTREALTVLKLVEEELSKKRYDVKTGEYLPVQPGDICILVRKNTGQAGEIARALTAAGYAVAGVQEGNICRTPEVRQVLDILSLIDDAEQDIPLATALLSPLGGISEDEAARIRIAFKREGKISFRRCCALYVQTFRNDVAKKLNLFYRKLARLRELAQILTAEELIDTLIAGSGLEAAYSAGTGEKLKNVRRLAAEGAKIPLAAFLAKIKAAGYDIKAATPAPADSIKIMTMHAAKGLEFPVVILADICKQFKGPEDSALPFDDKYGFAPMAYDDENMTVQNTVLRKLIKLRAAREELKNELNLFYVACTRAMCRLHILVSAPPAYSLRGAAKAKSYAQTFDIAGFAPVEYGPAEEGERAEEVEAAAPAPSGLAEEILKRFMRPYAYAASVDLPVKSSASAIIKSMREDEPYFAENKLFVGEEETGAERGIAYHRFLELCDFALKSPEEVAEELKNFTRSGKMTAEQAELVDAAQLSEILNMPVFAGLEGAETYREREFLCRLKACDVMDTGAEDYVLLQGAIDLMARTDGGVRIIDYKYSKKSDESLIQTYSAQLRLYKKVVSVILHTPESDISTAIVNIYAKRQIIL